jgi:hypothetical protein
MAEPALYFIGTLIACLGVGFGSYLFVKWLIER